MKPHQFASSGKHKHASCSTTATNATIATISATTSLPLTRPPGCFKSHITAQSVVTHCGRRTRAAGAHAMYFPLTNMFNSPRHHAGSGGGLRVFEHDAGGGRASHALSSQQKHVRLHKSRVTVCDDCCQLQRHTRTSGLPRPTGMSSGVMIILKT